MNKMHKSLYHVFIRDKGYLFMDNFYNRPMILVDNHEYTIKPLVYMTPNDLACHRFLLRYGLFK